MTGIAIRRAGLADLDGLAPLFDSYRQFYAQPSDEEGARNFLGERITCGESVIILALLDEGPVAFCQLYPSFTSVGLARTFILNDLFVAEEARKRGIARALLDHAAAWARKEGAVRLTLSTAHDNQPAQALYRDRGWARDEAFQVYHLPLQG